MLSRAAERSELLIDGFELGFQFLSALAEVFPPPFEFGDEI